MARTFLLLLSFLLAFLSGFFLGIHYALSFSSYEVAVKAAAVSSDGEGTLITIAGRLEPGYGRVFVSVEPKTQLDTQASAEIAVFVAQKLSGIPLGFRDVLFEIRAPTKIVEGPSAGAAMTILAYSLLTGKTPRQDVVITGTISPDGSVGEVGGLIEKLEACARGGVKIFLIPKGQRYYEYLEPYRTVYEPLPGVVVVRTGYVRKRIDLVEVGKKYGVRVIEVENIHEALPYFFHSERG